jgi:hypothetical protein
VAVIENWSWAWTGELRAAKRKRVRKKIVLERVFMAVTLEKLRSLSTPLNRGCPRITITPFPVMAESSSAKEEGCERSTAVLQVIFTPGS